MSQHIHLNKETKEHVQQITSVLNCDASKVLLNDDETMIEDLNSPDLLAKCLTLSQSTMR